MKKHTRSTDQRMAEHKQALEADIDSMDKQMQALTAGMAAAEGEHTRLQQQVAELSVTVSELQMARPTFANVVGQGGGQAPASGGKPELLQHKLFEESRQFGRTLKLVGIVSKEQGGPGGRDALARVKLCTEAGKALSALLGGVPVTVEKAVWLTVREGGAPKLLVVVPTLDMAQALRALRGPYGGPSKLATGQTITNEFGRVEQAVRRVLRQEQASVPWVGRSVLLSREASTGRVKEHPLSAAAIAAGLVAMHEAAQPARTQRGDAMAE